MALTRILAAWAIVFVWLLAWDLVASRLSGEAGPGFGARLGLGAGEGLLLTLLGALWFATLGAAAWWLVFALVGALREWPSPTAPARPRRRNGDGTGLGLRLLGVVRVVLAGGWLAWRLAPA